MAPLGVAYVQHSREEMEVLFTVLAEHYEKKSVVITSNLVFSQWDQIFKDPMTTMAAIPWSPPKIWKVGLAAIIGAEIEMTIKCPPRVVPDEIRH